MWPLDEVYLKIDGSLGEVLDVLVPPRDSLQPALPTTQMAVIFCDTSNPTKRVIDEPPTVRITG